MSGYWNAHSDRDWEEQSGSPDEPEPETELDQAYSDLAAAKLELEAAEGLIELLRMQVEAATEWARLRDRARSVQRQAAHS